MIVIPQRFQVVNGLSAFDAGWRLLALMLCSPLASILSGLLVTKVKVPPVYIFLAAAILQILGLALMGTLSISQHTVPSAQYGYQVILGLGIGLTQTLIIVAAPLAIEEKDTGTLISAMAHSIVPLILTALVAIFVGAMTQARILGGSLGLAVSTNILNGKLQSVSRLLSSEQLQGLFQSAQNIKTLPPHLQETVRQTFGRGYNEQMQALTAFGGAAVLITMMMWERKPRRMQQATPS